MPEPIMNCSRVTALRLANNRTHDGQFRLVRPMRDFNGADIPRCDPFDPLLGGALMLTGNQQGQHVRSDGLLQLRYVHGAGTA
jgi:hypothetical protein